MHPIHPGFPTPIAPGASAATGNTRPPSERPAGAGSSAFDAALQRTLADDRPHSPRVAAVLQDVQQANADQQALERQADAILRQWARLGHTFPRRV